MESVLSPSIGLVWIVASDLEKAVKYYSEVIGLEVIEVHEQFGWAELSGLDGSRLGIAQANPQMDIPAGSNAIVCLNVPDIEKAREELIAKGASLLGEIMEIPGHVKLQMLADVDGNRMQLAETL